MNQRTKNRLREHNVEEDPIRLVSSGVTFKRAVFDGEPHAHFRCIDEGCGWTGWLPETVLDLL